MAVILSLSVASVPLFPSFFPSASGLMYIRPFCTSWAVGGVRQTRSNLGIEDKRYCHAFVTNSTSSLIDCNFYEETITPFDGNSTFSSSGTSPGTTKLIARSWELQEHWQTCVVIIDRSRAAIQKALETFIKS